MNTMKNLEKKALEEERYGKHYLLKSYAVNDYQRLCGM
jgi:hypothetical protein